MFHKTYFSEGRKVSAALSSDKLDMVNYKLLIQLRPVPSYRIRIFLNQRAKETS